MQAIQLIKVFDTDVIIDFLRGDEETEEFAQQFEEGVAVTSITLAELYHGAEKSTKTEEHREDIEELKEHLQILHTTSRSSKIFGEKRAGLEKKGKLVDDMDLLISSIVIAEDLEIVTRNTSHFNKIEELEVHRPEELRKENKD
ncbi:MAG: type II toxin-antitoxin system VapC family toxin [Candidatus Nanohaloarchaea archaeon]